ncbi:uncharacterized protein LOC144884172 isoform X2 [Branchiostoma floridae x Branchiostoma japonicum]
MDARFAIQTFMVAGILSSHQAEAPGQRCNKVTEYPHGHKCCKLCPAGTHVLDACEQNHDVSTCVECPPNTFTAFDNGLKECQRCRNACNRQWGEEEISNCTSHHDRACRCKKGTYKYHETCKNHTPCPAGYGVVRKGSYRKDTVCKPCPPGTYSKRSSIFEKCKPWTNCATLGLTTREDGNASKDARCGDRLLPQQATPTPTSTSGPLHTKSTTRPMVTPTAAATVPQNSSLDDEETTTLAGTTLGSTAVTSTPTTSQITTPNSDKSTTDTENSSGEDEKAGPNIQPTIEVSYLVIIIISAVILVLIIIGFSVWCHYKKMEEREKIDGQPPIGAARPHHQHQLHGPDQGGNLNPQARQEPNEQQALLPGMEHGEGELEPNHNAQPRGAEQNQRGVQIYVPPDTGAPEGQQFNLGVYQDRRCLYDARSQTVQLQIQNATVHHHFGSPEFVQIGASNTINQNASTAGATNPESTDSEITDSEFQENEV